MCVAFFRGSVTFAIVRDCRPLQLECVPSFSKFSGGVGRYRRYQQSLPRDRGGRLGHPRVLSRLRYDMLLHRGRGPESLSQGVTPQIGLLEPIFGPIAIESPSGAVETV